MDLPASGVLGDSGVYFRLSKDLRSFPKLTSSFVHFSSNCNDCVGGDGRGEEVKISDIF